MYKYILLDLDGTIMDSEEGITKSIAYALEYYGIDVPPIEKLRTYIGPPLTGSFMDDFNMTREEAIDAIYKFRERYNVKCAIEAKPYDGVKEGLKFLREKGFKLYLCSSKNEPACHTILKYHNLDKYFDDIVGATEDTSRETKQEVIEEFFRRVSDATKEDTILVGDSKYDIEGARLCKIDSIGVSYGFGNVHEMNENGAKIILNNFKEVCEYVWKH